MRLTTTRRLDLTRVTVGALFLSLVLTSSSVPQLASLASVGRVAFIVALLLLLAQRPPHRRGLRRASLVFTALWMCVSVAVVSAIWSYTPLYTFFYGSSLGILVLTLHFFVYRRWRSKTDVVADLRAIFLVLSVVTVVGLAAVILGFDFAVGGDRGRGLFQNANKFGGVSALAAALGLALWNYDKRRLYLVLAAPLIVAVVASGSRTAIIAIVLAGFLYIATAPLGVKLSLGWIAAFFSTLWLLLRSFDLVDPLAEQGGTLGRFLLAEDEIALSGRVAIWEYSLDVAGNSPLGVGFGAAPAYLTAMGSASAIDTGSVHNSYLQWFLETGFVGVLPLLFLLTVIVFLCLRLQVGGSHNVLAPVVIAGLSMQITESGIFGVGQYYPWLFWLVVVALASLKDRESETIADDAVVLDPSPRSNRS